MENLRQPFESSSKGANGETVRRDANGETQRNAQQRRRQQKQQDDLFLLLSLYMMHPPETEAEEDPAMEAEAAKGFGFENVEEYREWKRETRERGIPPEQAFAQLPPENLRRITQNPDGTRNEEGYQRLGAMASGSLLNLIAAKESGGNYDVVYGGKDSITFNGQQRQITDMTVREVLQWQRDQRAAGADSTAAGRYQIIYKTLNALSADMKIDGVSVLDMKFDETVQDRMALELLKQRGFNKYLQGNLSEEAFMRNLSQEWASFPKDFSGLSYYHGDGLNKAGVSPHTVLAAMRGAREQYLAAPGTTQERQLAAATGGTPGPIDDTKIAGASNEGREQFQRTATPPQPAPKPAEPGLATQFATAVTNKAHEAAASVGNFFTKTLGWG